ncbi:e3 ubiquitin-protein ligase [Nicotiana attenuata]|uniref:E3 ubiquitin-protein ligase n=1 Tax=Nicotiana attenuata TaxID=49451 RepID=A0A314L5L6_NICAT|nr:e3 ubiquitin-protein ligase [Nicotiana attenuata]
MSPASLAISFVFLSIIFSSIFNRTFLSKLLNYIDFIVTHLKWGWNVVLFQSFSHSCNYNFTTISEDSATTPHDHNNELRVRRYDHDSGSNLDSVECAICLCNIEDGEEVRELRCDHVFHRVCLDRWMNCGRNMTCPLCRNHLKPNALFSELNHHQEVIHLDFLSGRSRDHCQWWIR